MNEKQQTSMTPSEILQKHEDANEMHFHEVDRKWIIEAMEEYAKEKSEIPIISDNEIEKASYKFWGFTGYTQSTCWKMGAKEKAEEMMHYYLKELLSAKYSINGFVINDLAKQCAFIAVDEVFRNNTDESKHDYWIEVKKEIEKL